MIRQVRNLIAPPLSTVADAVGPVYGFAVTMPHGGFAATGLLTDRVWVTPIRSDGAAELPILVNPAERTWFSFTHPLDGIRINSPGAASVCIDLWYSTSRAASLTVPAPKHARAMLCNTVFAAGAAVDTGSMWVEPFRLVAGNAFNAVGAAARDLWVEYQTESGAAMWSIALLAGWPAGSSRSLHVGDSQYAAAASHTSGLGLSPRIKITSVAAGAGDFTLQLWGSY